ncbi:hypothetical protein B0J18DRAFT_451092 [Chaetomium sp. MPI-SDFR-AT-0129]|nr:hypothetical protein B0J18DRAFT_451092 [Chaetomium sp. MPI-SDFR-AT-0129]
MKSSRSKSASPQDGGGPLRRLLPASGNIEEAGGFQGPPTPRRSPMSGPGPGPSSSSAVVPARRKRAQATTAACGACRKRKSKCDGGRPMCSICRDRGTACKFETNAAETHTQALKRKFNELQSQKSAFEQVYEVLQTRSEEEAGSVFRRIRRGSDAGSILRHVSYGDVLVQLALVPESRYRFDFPYLPDMPPFLRNLDNPYLDSEVYDYSLRQLTNEPHQPVGSPPTPEKEQSPVSDADSVYGAGPQDPYSKPYQFATVVHPWLDSVKPSKWTNVCDDDVLMRKLIHDYLLFEYDWFPFFHKDFFLEDMGTNNMRFCSPLLVNSILGFGCLCHRGLRGRTESWNPKSLGYQFLAEAKRLFETESEIPRPFRNPADPNWETRDKEWEQSRLTTLQSGLILTIIYDLNGSDKIGWRYTKKALELAEEINLLGPPLDYHDADTRCVRTYTAWHLFYWQNISSYLYLQAPPIQTPPQTPLPDPQEQPQWYGELWVRYPMSDARFPTYHGLLFKAIADLWVIVNEILVATFSRPHAYAKLPETQILDFLARLRAWFHNLPEPLTPRKIVMPHQLKLHMHYNQMLADLVTPILDYTGPPGMPPMTYTPQDVYHEAINHLETLLRLYYLRHGYDAHDSLLLHFLGFLNHITMHAVETSQGSSFLAARRSTLLLMIKGIHDQSRSSYVARTVLRLQIGQMRPEDVELLRQFVELDPDQVVYGPLEQTMLTDWPTYMVGLENKADQLRQGKTLATTLETTMASLSLASSAEPSVASPISTRSSAG